MSDEIRPVTPDADRARLIAELRQAASDCLFEVGVETWNGAAGNLFRRAADLLAAEGWRNISTAPKDGTYVLLGAPGYLSDVAVWQPERPELNNRGTRILARPEGWFSRDGTRSVLDNKATHYHSLPSSPGGGR